jgi:hypothetical protein
VDAGDEHRPALVGRGSGEDPACHPAAVDACLTHVRRQQRCDGSGSRRLKSSRSSYWTHCRVVRWSVCRFISGSSARADEAGPVWEALGEQLALLHRASPDRVPDGLRTVLPHDTPDPSAGTDPLVDSGALQRPTAVAAAERVSTATAMPWAVGRFAAERRALTATMCGRTVLPSLQICVPGFTKSARASTGAPGHELGLGHLMGWCGRWATRPLWGPSRRLATTAE